jgi:hypothetical protein
MNILLVFFGYFLWRFSIELNKYSVSIFWIFLWRFSIELNEYSVSIFVDIFERCAKRNTFDIYNYKIKMNKREPGYFCG